MDKQYWDQGEALMRCRESARQHYLDTHCRAADPYIWWLENLLQLQATWIERPGGRHTLHLIITGKRRLPLEHYYWRFQWTQDGHYVQIKHKHG